LRYVCHILSGVIIWGVYAEEGQSVLAYSIIYNGTYMIPEIIITTIVTALMIPLIRRIER
ncbi:MAG: energy-coupled thiamine transporter ThiT, partial [Eubacteriales bacterium]|nr:energy-coupled thiamine transporter ThiT [Eubacteriales bacterium]